MLGQLLKAANAYTGQMKICSRDNKKLVCNRLLKCMLTLELSHLSSENLNKPSYPPQSSCDWLKSFASWLAVVEQVWSDGRPFFEVVQTGGENRSHVLAQFNVEYYEHICVGIFCRSFSNFCDVMNIAITEFLSLFYRWVAPCAAPVPVFTESTEVTFFLWHTLGMKTDKSLSIDRRNDTVDKTVYNTKHAMRKNVHPHVEHGWLQVFTPVNDTDD